MPLRAVIFDFDGVIANSEPLHLRAYQEVLAEIGVTLTSADYYARYLGYDDVGMFKAVASDRDQRLDDGELFKLITAKSERLDVWLGGADVVVPDAIDCVRRLAAALPLAIASGALLKEIEMILERVGLRDCFHAIVSADAGVRSKPAPDPYLRAVELLEASKHLEPRTKHQKPNTKHQAPSTQDRSLSCYVAIEDSRWGIESALAAGLHCVAVTQTYDQGELGHADLVVPNLSALTLDMLRDLCDRDR